MFDVIYTSFLIVAVLYSLVKAIETANKYEAF